MVMSANRLSGAWLCTLKRSYFEAGITLINWSQNHSHEQLVHAAAAHIPSSPFNTFHRVQLISRLETDFTHVVKDRHDSRCQSLNVAAFAGLALK